MEIQIKLTTAGVDTDFFTISGSSDGIIFNTELATNVSRISLINGYDLSGVPSNTISIRLKSNTSSCQNIIDIPITNFPTPTPTVTVTPTVTSSPMVIVTPTPTVTPTVAPYWYILTKCSGSGNYYAGSYTTVPQLPINRQVIGPLSEYYVISNIVYSQPSIFYTQVSSITDNFVSGCPNVTPTPTVTTTVTKTPTVTPTPTPVQYLFFKFSKCDGSYCYMSESTYNYYVLQYGSSYFQTGNRYYGAIEGDPNYLYTYTGLIEYLTTPTPSCQITGVSSTTDVCP